MTAHDKLAEAREALRREFPEPWALRLRANSASNPDAWCSEAKLIGPAARQVVAVEAWGESPAVAVAELLLAWRRASAAALASARAEGAAEAFERAAKVATPEWLRAAYYYTSPDTAERDHHRAPDISAWRNVAAAIRALAEKERI